jgi:preprotein translocase subunit SecA
MRSSVNLRAYGQRDPLVEYKREGLRLFKDMEYSVDQEIIKILAQVQGEVKEGENVPVIELKADADSYVKGALSETVQLNEGEKVVSISSDPKIGRNDPCPCGSGKKYKKCHGA